MGTIKLSNETTNGSNLQYLSDHSLFESTSAFNEAVTDHLSRCNRQLNETDRDVLMMLSRYSVKYAGVAHLKAETIAMHVNKSKRTVQRSISKLVRLHIIERKSFYRRVSGGNGANVYVFLPPNDMAECHSVEVVENTAAATDQVDNSTNEPFSLKITKELNNNVLEPSIHNDVDNLIVTNSDEQQPAEYLETSHKRPYKRFKDAVMTYIGNSDRSLIYRLYGVYLSQTKALRKAYDADFLIDIAIRGLQATFHATKRKEINNIPGYFNGAFSNMLDDLATQTMIEFYEYANGGNDSIYDNVY